MELNIFSIAFNEELILPFMINFYKQRIPSAKFTIFDNQSTDNTKNIALEMGCEVIEWNTNNEIDDEKIKQLKNNCWKNKKNWIMIIDPDECLNISEKELEQEEINGTTIIKSFGYNMVNMLDDLNLTNIKYGVPEPNYSKNYLFNSNLISEINYNHGAHSSNPSGHIKYSEKIYSLYHYKYINPDWLVERTKYTYTRLSLLNRQMRFGTQWLVNEQQVRDNFEEQRRRAIKVIE